jgi:predicted dehydrogenase
MASVVHAMAARAAGLQVVAVASRTDAHALARARELGAVAAEPRWLPGTGDERADLVVVATPPSAHAADAVRLLDTGVAVMVQTPLAATLADADLICAAAERNGQRACYAEQLVHAPAVEQLMELIPSLGPVQHAEYRAVQGRPRWGDPATGRGSEAWGGGVLLDLAVHPVAMAIWCGHAAGAGSVVGASASVGRTGADGGDEQVSVVVHHADGLRSRVEAEWSPRAESLWDLQLSSATGVLRAEVLPVPTLERNGEPLTLRGPGATTPEVAAYGYLGQLQDFVTDVYRGATPRSSVVFGRSVLEVICAAAASIAAGGELVPLPVTEGRHLSPWQLMRG